MRDYKIRIIIENDVQVSQKHYYISEIALGLKKLFDVDNWKILAYNQRIDLVDIKGVDLYEDDIIKIQDEYCLVEYVRSDNGFLIFYGGDWWGMSYLKGYCNFEIVGNKYKNSDLLPKEDDE